MSATHSAASAASGSPASDRSLESHYRAVASGDRHIQVTTPSPPAQQDDSNDEYTPTRQSAQSASSGTVWITPSHRSSTASMATKVRTALEKLYKKIYGEDSIRCLLTLGKGGLNVAHAVQRASKLPDLTLYEYCLGFDFSGFHVDSRQNLFYLKSDWHAQFDADRWILLPSAAVLEDVRGFIQSVISARKEPSPSQAAIPTFDSKWCLESKTKYTFIPLPSIERDPLIHPKLAETGQLGQWELHFYPYQTLPDLECHIAPPYAAINGGPKCAGTDLDALTLDYCGQSSDSRPALKHRLELLREIWEIFENAKEDASNWEQSKRGKRKREQDDEEIERLTQSSQRTTRSQSRISEARGPNGDNVKHTIHTSGSRKRKAAPSSSGRTLTECAVFHLSKRQKTSDFRTTVERWAESIYGY